MAAGPQHLENREQRAQSWSLVEARSRVPIWLSFYTVVHRGSVRGDRPAWSAGVFGHWRDRLLPRGRRIGEGRVLTAHAWHDQRPGGRLQGRRWGQAASERWRGRRPGRLRRGRDRAAWRGRHFGSGLEQVHALVPAPLRPSARVLQRGSSLLPGVRGC